MTKTPDWKMVHLLSLAFRKASLNHIMVDPMTGKHILPQIELMLGLWIRQNAFVIMGWSDLFSFSPFSMCMAHGISTHPDRNLFFHWRICLGIALFC